MKQAVLYSAMTVMLSFLLILGVVGLIPRGAEPDENVETAAVPAEQVVRADRQILLRLQTDAGVEQIDLQSYLLGVLSCEMPLSFEPAALQAQAVASRTFTLYHCGGEKHPQADVCDDASCCQAWKAEPELAQTYGAQWSTWRERALDAVTSTDGQVLTRDGELINAVFFACSGGMTEPAAAVWGGEVAYLQAVPSPGEEIAAAYTGQTAVTLTDFQQKLSAEEPAVAWSDNPASWFGAVTYSPGGGVAQMEIGGVRFAGIRLRSLFGLNSTWFTVAVTEQEIVFHTRGKGHRVGMSQYGAQAMALSGSTYDRILTHYYTGVTLTDYMAS